MRSGEQSEEEPRAPREAESRRCPYKPVPASRTILYDPTAVSGTHPRAWFPYCATGMSGTHSIFVLGSSVCWYGVCSSRPDLYCEWWYQAVSDCIVDAGPGAYLNCLSIKVIVVLKVLLVLATRSIRTRARSRCSASRGRVRAGRSNPMICPESESDKSTFPLSSPETLRLVPQSFNPPRQPEPTITTSTTDQGPSPGKIMMCHESCGHGYMSCNRDRMTQVLATKPEGIQPENKVA
eukprot:2544365-Rhodomonas_salina.1